MSFFQVNNTDFVSLGQPPDITEFVYQALQKNGEAEAAVLDISKVFDRVWHAGEVHKFKGYGVCGRIFKLIQPSLTNRVMKIMINDQAFRTFYLIITYLHHEL